MKYIKKIYKMVKIKINKIGAKKRNKKLLLKEFTIISNNCYGGLKYENLDLCFNSPTIGLYFYAPEYLKFISNLKHYINCELKFIDSKDSKYYDDLLKKNQANKIIGLLDDVEIVFLHYESKEEAKEKWTKRCERINWNFIIYKFNDQNLCTYDDLKKFNSLKLKNKICFTAKKYPELNCCIQIKKYRDKKYVKDDSFFNNKYLNFVDYVNNIYLTDSKKSDKIRVLHVLNKMHTGGAETMVMNFYRQIDKNKIQFDFVVNHPGEYDEEIKKLGGKIFILPEYKLFNHFSYKKAWNNFFKKHTEYRIIHGHVRSTASIYLKIAKKYKLKTICHSHSISNGRGIKSSIKALLQYKIRFICDYYMGCSKEANEWLFGKKVANSKKCFVLNNGIEISKFQFSDEYRNEIRKKLNIYKNEILIGNIGRFVNVKNQKFILEFFKELIIEDNNFRLVLCGDGPDKQKMIRYAKNNNIYNYIKFIPSNNEIYKYYSAFDLFVLPSKYEGLGIVLVEAQVSGIPCITSNNVPHAVKINNNFYFEKLDVKIWKKRINIINYKCDRKINIKKFNKFDINIVASQLSNFYIKLLKEVK